MPVAFFAWQGKPSVLVPEAAEVFTLARPDQDCAGVLDALAETFDAPAQLQPAVPVVAPSGPITIEGIAATVAATLPEQAIVVDESITSGRGLMAATKGGPRHDWLVNTGGSIGIGMPLAVGAAVACPDRPVLCLEADGSGMYTLQALWTAAREGLAITIVVFANRAYQILKGELAAVGNPGRARSTCSRSAVPTSTGSSLRAAWACRRGGWIRSTPSSARSRTASPAAPEPHRGAALIVIPGAAGEDGCAAGRRNSRR